MVFAKGYITGSPHCLSKANSNELNCSVQHNFMVLG